MKSKIIDMMFVIAPDQRTLAVEVFKYLKRGWHRHGETREMRPDHDLSKLVYMQTVVLTNQPNETFVVGQTSPASQLLRLDDGFLLWLLDWRIAGLKSDSVCAL